MIGHKPKVKNKNGRLAKIRCGRSSWSRKKLRRQRRRGEGRVGGGGGGGGGGYAAKEGRKIKTIIHWKRQGETSRYVSWVGRGQLELLVDTHWNLIYMSVTDQGCFE